jgi:hypothetical protein
MQKARKGSLLDTNTSSYTGTAHEGMYSTADGRTAVLLHKQAMQGRDTQLLYGTNLSGEQQQHTSHAADVVTVDTTPAHQHSSAIGRGQLDSWQHMGHS